MHNRGRLIVADFLSKLCQVDWRLGEKYFARQLVDYCPIVNNLSWQTQSITGMDRQAFIRIYNPELQQLKYDPKFEYLRKWCPEYREMTDKQIKQIYKDLREDFQLRK